ncbi:unnamed protein product [Rhizophagus irregularis]|uniref:Uncharacterized protein n=1 Tax=Rhizophagus irregularis TaxID=588596 RepID=A0A915Z7T0_9GLOM|nr:unnamed protein product [Rhizophagus irregularis]CAB5364701.1 unnamed protein product [Rhizophagus irregularis]
MQKTIYSTKREKAANEQRLISKLGLQMSATRYRKGVATVVDADHRSRTEARAYDKDYINNNNITLNDVQNSAVHYSISHFKRKIIQNMNSRIMKISLKQLIHNLRSDTYEFPEKKKRSAIYPTMKR